MFTNEHKEFLDKVRKDEHDRIMTMELLIWQEKEKIKTKTEYLDVIAKRDDGFYKSAYARTEDQKETEAAIKLAEADLKRYEDQIETAKESLDLFDAYEAHLKSTE